MQVRREQHLRIGVCAEPVAFLLELGLEFQVVVDLAVEHEVYEALAVRHRLLAGNQVDDLEPPVRKADLPRTIESMLVRSAMGQNVGHALQPFRRGRRRCVKL